MSFNTKGIDVIDAGRVLVSEAGGIIALSACWADGVTSVEMTAAQAEEIIAELTLAAKSGRVSIERKRIGLPEVTPHGL